MLISSACVTTLRTDSFTISLPKMALPGRGVYFNQKPAPASVMVSKNKPLRQIQFLGHGYTVVLHRTRAYNQVVPPPKSDSTTHETEDGSPTANDDTITAPDSDASPAIEDDVGSIPPEYNDQSDSDNSSDNADMASDAASEGEPHSGDQSDSESNQRSEMEGLESDSIVVLPKSIWPAGKFPISPVGHNQESNFSPACILRAKRLGFGTSLNPPRISAACLPLKINIRRFHPLTLMSGWVKGLADRSLTPPQAGIQETTFSCLKNFKRAKYLWMKASRLKLSFGHKTI
ncbi:hypothetical protein PHMEG_00012611 [Phytophthora megakarya]|uniref:Uncharacterized protein n=1 Tax=Phytophthora megakarya TaxID=4795 RepID=A0A225WAW4_9STRA|nr:hypothetical protein PHMEG_00012611 [Phytophthora megakarya]